MPWSVFDSSGAVMAEIETGTAWQTVKRSLRGRGLGTLRWRASCRELPLYADFPARASFAALPFPEASELSREEQLLYLALRLVIVVGSAWAT